MENNSIYIIGWIALTLLIAWFLTKGLRRYALDKNILDVPNERSSHTNVTPRGGGLAIVIAFFINMVSLFASDHISSSAFWGIFGSSLLIAVTGFLDDRKPIPSKARLIVHFLAAIWIVSWLGKIPAITFFSYSIDLGIFASILAVFYLVWLLNLYNFMDGIDGIASIEAITVCFGGGVLLYLLSSNTYFWLIPILLGSGTAGFILWNWPPAKIFMGDVGSAFLGITIGAISLFSLSYGSQLIWAWVILLGAFIVDATVTLFRRVARGESFDEAHRTHAYQYASRKHKSHKKVSIAVGAINVFWLLPIAGLVAFTKIDGVIGVLIAYAPLIAVVYYFRAGARDLQHDYP